MENLPEISSLAAAILTGTQLLLRYFPTVNKQLATLIVTILFAGIVLALPTGMGLIEVVLALLGQVFVYDFAVKPLLKK